LEQALASLREHTQGRLICVFGCGGNRDKGKRPMMGEIASRLADLAVVTSDNPRNENPGDIIQQVTAAMSGNYHIEPDRAAAIAFALGQAGPKDIVLLAGKGHEQYQEIGNQSIPFSDASVAAQILADLRGAA
jgi:UDP-N-acetylmuramoyl-L-alanyl-D-glutamate--2,6-diaminopimelate ligase